MYILQFNDAGDDWDHGILLFNDFICIEGHVGEVSFNLKVHAASLQQKQETRPK